MPFYEYKCPKCELEVLEFRLMKERDEPLACTKCPQVQLERVVAVLQSKKELTDSPETRVKEFLESAKGDLKQNKQDLSRRTK